MKHIPKVLRQFTDKLFVYPFQLVVPSDYVAVGYGSVKVNINLLLKGLPEGKTLQVA